MSRRRDRDVNWSPEAKEQLLRHLGEFNLLNSAGTTPNRDKFTQWATELSNHFSIPFSWDKVKQKAARLKKTFEAEFLLRTATGFGWDPIEKRPTCTDQYWQQFVTSHPEVERARRKPLAEYDLYYCAFVNSRATGVNEYGQEEAPITPPYPLETIPTSPIDIDGGSQHFNDTFENDYTEMRPGVSGGGRTPHVASQSRLNNKRSARHSQTRVPNFMECAVDRLVSSIEDHGRKRGKSSATPPSVEKETFEDKCIDLLGELEIPQDQYLFMFNFLTAHATLQRPFLRMKEHHRLAWIQQMMEQHANQQVPPPPPPFMPVSPHPFQSRNPMNQHFTHSFHPTVNTFQPTTSNFQPYMPPPNFPPFSSPNRGDNGSHPL